MHRNRLFYIRILVDNYKQISLVPISKFILMYRDSSMLNYSKALGVVL